MVTVLVVAWQVDGDFHYPLGNFSNQRLLVPVGCCLLGFGGQFIKDDNALADFSEQVVGLPRTGPAFAKDNLEVV